MERMKQEICCEVYMAIHKLPDKCRQIVLMKLEGSENDEIALRLGMSEEAVCSELKSGRRVLQKQLKSLMALAALSCVFA